MIKNDAKLLENNSELHFPKMIYINNINKYKTKSFVDVIAKMPAGKYIIKPINESANIGVKQFELCSDNSKQVYTDLLEYSKIIPLM